MSAHNLHLHLHLLSKSLNTPWSQRLQDRHSFGLIRELVRNNERRREKYISIEAAPEDLAISMTETAAQQAISGGDRIMMDLDIALRHETLSRPPRIVLCCCRFRFASRGAVGRHGQRQGTTHLLARLPLDGSQMGHGLSICSQTRSLG